MKVLMTADTIGGVWSYALELATTLSNRDITVELATQGAPLSADQRRELDAVPNVTLHESTFQLEWMDEPWDDVSRAGEWLLGLEQRLRPDVLHLNDYSHGALPWHTPALVVGHSCVLSWWRAVKGCAAPRRYDRYYENVRAGLLAAQAIVAPSGSMAEALAHHYGPIEGVRVIPNGRDPMRFTPARKESFVFAAGRVWDEAKNLSTLGIAAQGLPWSVFIAGDVRHPDGRQANTGHARSVGRLDASALARWYASASIYALPALYEPFGLAVLEAALSGCALVLGDIPTLRELWTDAAVFVPPHDPPALRAALLRLINDDGLRADLGREAARRARQHTALRMAEQYVSLYRELSGAGHAPVLVAS